MLERGAILHQESRRLAHGAEQGEHSLVRGDLLRGDAAIQKAALHVGEIEPEPGVQTFAQSAHLAMVRHRSERQRVQVIDDDVPTVRASIGTRSIGLQTRRRDLLELVQRRGRAPAGRVAELLDLRGERAATFGGERQAEASPNVQQPCLREPLPVERRIMPRALGPQQLAVLDEQQALDDERRHVLVALEEQSSGPCVEHHLPACTADHETAARLLAIRRRDAETGKLRRRLGHLRLLGDPIASQQEPVGEFRQAGVTELLIVRPAAGKYDPGARAGTDIVGELGGVAGEDAGLQARGAHLVDDREREQRAKENQPRPPARRSLVRPDGRGGGRTRLEHDPANPGILMLEHRTSRCRNERIPRRLRPAPARNRARGYVAGLRASGYEVEEP